MKTGRSLTDLAKEIERQMETKKDYIAPKGKLEMITELQPNLDLNKPAPQALVKISVPTNGHNTEHGITRTAHNQIAAVADIPSAYYQRMLASQPELLAKNVNTWFQAAPDERHMLRLLDGNLRAVMSDKYKRIDHYDVMEAILPLILGVDGLTIASSELTESKFYLKVISGKVLREVKPGDLFEGGFIVSNSEIGLGGYSVLPFLHRLICTNGAVVNEFGVKRRHVGRKIEEEDLNNGIHSERTLELDMQLLFSKSRDAVSACLDQAKFDVILDKWAAATKVAIKKPEEVVELTQKKFNLSDVERGSVFAHLLSSSDHTIYGLANAITRTAQDVESYDRATELEAIGYKVITMDPRDVTRL